MTDARLDRDERAKGTHETLHALPAPCRRWPTPEAVGEALGGGSVNGTLAKLIVLPEPAVIPTPAYMSDEEAATLPCGAAPFRVWGTSIQSGEP